MKNNRGFTLVELLGVLILLAIIGLIAVPTINNSIKRSEEKADASQRKIILRAAESWAAENTSELPETGSIVVEVKTLSNKNYISGDDLTEINTTNYIDMCVKITANTKYNNFDYELSDC